MDHTVFDLREITLNVVVDVFCYLMRLEEGKAAVYGYLGIHIDS